MEPNGENPFHTQEDIIFERAEAHKPHIRKKNKTRETQMVFGPSQLDTGEEEIGSME